MVQVELFHLRDGRRELAAYMRHLQNLLICLFAHDCQVELRGEPELIMIRVDESKNIISAWLSRFNLSDSFCATDRTWRVAKH